MPLGGQLGPDGVTLREYLEVQISGLEVKISAIELKLDKIDTKIDYLETDQVRYSGKNDQQVANRALWISLTAIGLTLVGLVLRALGV